MSGTLADLNDAQKAAATAADGAICIVAGPGTGKTKTLTARIAFLVERGHAAPEKILALTFTNKAAREMQARVGAKLSSQNAVETKAPGTLASIDEANPGVPRITTFHGLCYELLQGDGEDLRIINEADRLELLRELRTSQAATMPLRELSAKLSRAKNMPQPERAALRDLVLESLLQAYNQALRAQKYLDFDDLLQNLHARLQSDDAFRQKVQARWQYILVDEFQDTNELQYVLLKLLASHDNFFVIGDPLQSIYGFRGATGNIFSRFAHDFPQAQTITLTANYRSAPEIVAVSNALFADAPKLAAQQKISGKVGLVHVLNEYREAAWIVQAIEQDLGGTDFLRSHRVAGQERTRQFGDYAVLYRTHSRARALKRAFAESGVPFQCVGDDSPYAGKVLRASVAALRRSVFGKENLTPTDARLLKKIPRAALDGLAAKSSLPPSDFLAHAADALGLIKADNAAALSAFRQTLGTLVRFDNLTPEAFLAQFDELAEQDFFDARADAVTLMTIHAAKGLEFAHVFLIGAEDGILPHTPRHESKNIPQADADNFEEEKRLFYVAVTRAREQLTVLYAKMRAGQPAKLSPFAASLEATILPRLADPNLASQTRTATKRKFKNAQMGLF